MEKGEAAQSAVLSSHGPIFVCGHCDKSFVKRLKLNQHVLAKHEEDLSTEKMCLNLASRELWVDFHSGV